MFHLYLASFLFHLVDNIVNFSGYSPLCFDIFLYFPSRLAICVFLKIICILFISWQTSLYISNSSESLWIWSFFVYRKRLTNSFTLLFCMEAVQWEQTNMLQFLHWYLQNSFSCVSHQLQLDKSERSPLLKGNYDVLSIINRDTCMFSFLPVTQSDLNVQLWTTIFFSQDRIPSLFAFLWVIG